MKAQQTETITLDKIVGGGQALGTLQDGRKAFVWGGLPGETVTIDITKKKSRMIEGVTRQIIKNSLERIEAKDPESYLSTSPWQIMTYDAEQHYKAALIEEAFELHNIVLPGVIDIYSDNRLFEYRNKIEFSWWGDATDGVETLDIAFFRRGTKGKIPVQGTSLARSEINTLAHAIRDLLREKVVSGRSLKTLLIRCNQSGDCVWQLYVKDEIDVISDTDAASLPAQGGEVIFSDPRSPASRITKRLRHFGNTTLTDTVHGTSFRYASESFFQVNLPIYEQALTDMSHWLEGKPVLDMYSGVGTIGLTIGGEDTVLVEVDANAVKEMERNIEEIGSSAQAVLAPSEKALDYITSSRTIIVDPPRAGLHSDIIDKLLLEKPSRIIYLSCNPVTQARDVALLADMYGIRHHRGYNFFPRTPHIENLVILDLKQGE